MKSTHHVLIAILAASMSASAGAAYACCGSCGGGGSQSHAEHQQERPAVQTERLPLQGGHVQKTKDHYFETVFADDGIRVYVYNFQQSPLMVENATGLATLRLANGNKLELPLTVQEALSAEGGSGDGTVYFCPMHPEVVQSEPGECADCGGMTLQAQDRLFAAADLSNLSPQDLEVKIRIEGLDGKESKVSFKAAPQGRPSTLARSATATGGDHKEGHGGHGH